MTMDTLARRQAFISSHTQLLPVPHAPEIQLHLADDTTHLWLKTEEELGQIGLPPPFWAFAWAGGQALARYVMDHPQYVIGKRVLDFATGSGLVGIAAAKAGATHVTASDIDPFAIAALQLNAQFNGVTIEPVEADLTNAPGSWDVILAGDVSYENKMAQAVTTWLNRMHRQGVLVLIGDPGRAYLARDQLEPIANYRVPVMRDLEDLEVKNTSVWRFTEPVAQTSAT